MKIIKTESLLLCIFFAAHAMEETSLPILQEPFNDEARWSLLVKSLTQKNVIPNLFTIDETDSSTPTTYTALQSLYPEREFCYDIGNDYSLKLEKEDFSPTLLLAVCPHYEDTSPIHIGPSKPEKKILKTNSDFPITTVALRKNDHQVDVLIGRYDGTITLFDLEHDTYYERSLSLNPICSVAFDHNGMLVATDNQNRLFLLNPTTNVAISIKNNNGDKLLCPSLNDDQILIVQNYQLTLSSSLPLKFLNHELTPQQSTFLLCYAQIKEAASQKKLDIQVAHHMYDVLPDYNFEPLVQQELSKKLQGLIKANTPKKTVPFLQYLKNNASDGFKKLQQCYNSLIQQSEPTPSDIP